MSLLEFIIRSWKIENKIGEASGPQMQLEEILWMAMIFSMFLWNTDVILKNRFLFSD